MMLESPKPAEHSWVRRERSTLVVLAVLTALVVGLATTLVVRSGDDRPRATVGDVFIGPAVDDELLTSTEVVLPWARVDAGISAPMPELPWGDEGSDDESVSPVRPPTDGSFIRVTMEPDTDHQMTFFSTNSPMAGKAEVVLTAGGRDYPINPAGFNLDADWPLINLGGRFDAGFGGTVWIAVAGQPTDASLSITVDGDTQVLADGDVSGGRAEELSALPSPEQIPRLPALRCGRPKIIATDGLTFHGREYLRCKRSLVVRSPYVDGLGWAQEGRDFLVLYLATDTRSLRLLGNADDNAWWLRQAAQLTVTADGQPALAEGWPTGTPAAPTNTEVPKQFVFDVPSDTPVRQFDVAFTLDVAPADPRDIDPRRGELRWRLPSGDPAGGTQ